MKNIFYSHFNFYNLFNIYHNYYSTLTTLTVGSTQRLPYVTMGSGSLAAMAVFEARYNEDMDETAAVTLVRDAIRAGK